jgi:hypothetical protein
VETAPLRQLRNSQLRKFDTFLCAVHAYLNSSGAHMGAVLPSVIFVTFLFLVTAFL